MSKNHKLVIVESPAKAKTIHRILGPDYLVRASLGHIRDLPEKRLGVDPENGFRPQYVLIKGREKVVRELKQAAETASAVYLAPDPDREGEAIAWHLREVLREAVPSDRFLRVTYNEITPSAIRRAFTEPRELDMHKVDAQQARRVLDRLVGYKVSPLLWRRIRGAESAGRVQSVALRLICEREEAIRAFVPEEYWVLGAKVAKCVEPRTPFVVRLALLDGQKPRVPDRAAAENLLADLDDRPLRVRAIRRREMVRRAPPPFITSSLQQAASRQLGMSPARTMRVAQTLYEGVDLGQGPVGLITYMRTDSVNVAAEAVESARHFIERTYGAEFAPPRPNVFRSRSGAQEAHECIRPTDVERTPEALANRLKPDEWRLYRLIWQRFVASQMSPAILAERTAEVEAIRTPEARHEYLFKATAEEILFPGFLRAADVVVLNEKDKEEESDEEETAEALPPLEEGETLDRLEWLSDQKFTKPPPRYTEASLVKALEEYGIGRPSTYAQILSTLNERKYVRKEKKRQLAPTELGLRTYAFLVQHLEPLFNVRFTAQMEEALDEIEKGRHEWTAMLQDFYRRLQQWLAQARGPDADAEEAADLIRALSHVRQWQPPPEPAPGRKRAYAGDQAFYESVRRQFEAGEKPLSHRQVEALKQLVVRYHTQAPELAAAVERWHLPVPENGALPGQPSSLQRRKIALLATVQFEPPRKSGHRVFDDAAFYDSLRKQVESGRALTERQEEFLDRLIVKYLEQIPDHEAVAAELGLGSAEDKAPASADPEEVQRLLNFFEHLTEWKPPQKRGNRVWDDREFYESVARQFRARGSITPRQLKALHKMAARYDFE